MTMIRLQCTTRPPPGSQVFVTPLLRDKKQRDLTLDRLRGKAEVGSLWVDHAACYNFDGSAARKRPHTDSHLLYLASMADGESIASPEAVPPPELTPSSGAMANSQPLPLPSDTTKT